MYLINTLDTSNVNLQHFLILLSSITGYLLLFSILSSSSFIVAIYASYSAIVADASRGLRVRSVIIYNIMKVFFLNNIMSCNRKQAGFSGSNQTNSLSVEGIYETGTECNH